jgi:hypothetical protein
MRCSMSAVRTGLVLMVLVMIAACSSSSPNDRYVKCHTHDLPRRDNS